MAFLEGIRELLKSGEFWLVEGGRDDPQRVIGETEKLGIPTVADRVVQTALKAVLEPVFEADFLPCHTGSARTGVPMTRSPRSTIWHPYPRDYRWVLEADIAACFDEIGHVPLLDRVRARIKDKRVVALVRAFLKAGILTKFGDRERHAPRPDPTPADDRPAARQRHQQRRRRQHRRADRGDRRDPRQLSAAGAGPPGRGRVLHKLLEHIVTGGGVTGRSWEFSVGWSCTDREIDAIDATPKAVWGERDRPGRRPAGRHLGRRHHRPAGPVRVDREDPRTSDHRPGRAAAPQVHPAGQ